MKKFLSYFAVAFSIFISIIFPVNAYYNLGSLELKPLTGNNPEWFIEYLKPGQTAQGRIQISNFDSQEKKIQLYSADNADNEDAHFFIQTAEEVKPAEANIGQWITLPVHELTLKPQESRIVDFSFVIPQKAGVGLHKGAVIAREITIDSNGNEIKFEKGLRVYVNVMGPSINSSYQKNELFDESYKQFHYQATTVNNGTTDLEATYGLGLEGVWGPSVPEAWESHKIKPGESFTADISLQKPDIGIYNVFVLKGEEKHFLKTVIFIPLWLASMIVIALAVMIKGVEKIKKVLRKISRATLPEYRKGFAYWGIFLVIMATFFSAQGSWPIQANAQLPVQKMANDYKVTLRWGNVRGFILPQKLTQEWDGKISLTEGTVSIEELTNFEKNDMAEVINNGQAVQWKTTTGPDNDGMILKISTLEKSAPVLTYKNMLNGNDLSFPLSDISNQPLVIPNGLFSLEIKSEPIIQEIQTIKELDASAEAQDQNEEKKAPELQNLFVDDLPPTAEALEKFILESDYVKDITTDQKTSKVEADPILIKALQDRSDVLDQVAGNANVNYIFIPTDTINFPPQEFSFNKTTSSTQELGSMIFVQNKKTPWNTYVSTTNLTSLSGKGRIPASAVTIMPGQPHILNEESNADIQMGANKNFRNTSDKSVLVNVNPGNASDQIFVLTPRLEIHVPAGTLPGKYRGSLTITSL